VIQVLILGADGFEDTELLVPLYRLKEAGHEVVLAGPKPGPITGKHGYSVTVDVTFEQVESADYDAVVIPGGKAPETVRLNPAAVAADASLAKAAAAPWK